MNLEAIQNTDFHPFICPLLQPLYYSGIQAKVRKYLPSREKRHTQGVYCFWPKGHIHCHVFKDLPCSYTYLQKLQAWASEQLCCMTTSASKSKRGDAPAPPKSAWLTFKHTYKTAVEWQEILSASTIVLLAVHKSIILLLFFICSKTLAGH